MIEKVTFTVKVFVKYNDLHYMKAINLAGFAIHLATDKTFGKKMFLFLFLIGRGEPSLGLLKGRLDFFYSVY